MRTFAVICTLAILSLGAIAQTFALTYAFLGWPNIEPDHVSPGGIAYNDGGYAPGATKLAKSANKIIARGGSEADITRMNAAVGLDYGPSLDAAWQLALNTFRACGYNVSGVRQPAKVIIQPTLWTDSIPGEHDGEQFPDGTIWLVDFYVGSDGQSHYGVDALAPSSPAQTWLSVWEFENWIRAQLGLSGEGPCQ